MVSKCSLQSFHFFNVYFEGGISDFSLSEIENEECFMLYRNKSFSVVRDFIEKQEFPENYKIALY
ncbi:hypothetical protein AXF03_03240 [Staphylococcus aureus]|nr:hypothetical protein [Staphylococcus aureus]MCO4431712.1 hypothetical protein [Staphylococcus aureus]